MKNKKNIWIAVLLFCFLIIGVFYYYNFYEINSGQPYLSKGENIKITPQIEVKPLSEKKIYKNEKNIDVSLKVLDKNYNISTKEGNSVYDMMKNLQDNKGNIFSFGHKEYPSLGIFVDEINKVKGGNGKYWIYSVNGKEALVGVSKYVLKDGDIINWELK